MKSKSAKRPKLSTFLKAEGWTFDGFAGCGRVFKHPILSLVILIETDDYAWTLTTYPDCKGQLAGKGKTALVAQLKIEKENAR